MLNLESRLRWYASGVLAHIAKTMGNLHVMWFMSAASRKGNDVIKSHLRKWKFLTTDLTNAMITFVNGERVNALRRRAITPPGLIAPNALADLDDMHTPIESNMRQPTPSIAFVRFAIHFANHVSMRIAPILIGAWLTTRDAKAASSHSFTTAVAKLGRRWSLRFQMYSGIFRATPPCSFVARVTTFTTEAALILRAERGATRFTNAGWSKVDGHRQILTSGVMRLGVISVGAALIILAPAPPVYADHQIYLPYAGQTWMAQQIKANQEQVWCLDSRAEFYPNFLIQLRDVNDQYTARVGIRNRQVPIDDPACEIRHLMLPAFPCGNEAAACIYYGNKPVDVFYKWQLGFTDWRTAQGHELGHGILGQLHERYRDSGGSIGCGGTDEVGLTVMQCGSPNVRYPTDLDVDRGCAIILASWCGAKAPEPPAPYQDCTTYPGWTGTVSCYWPQYEAWLWVIVDAQGREQLWEWSPADPRWRCTRGCPT